MSRRGSHRSPALIVLCGVVLCAVGCSGSSRSAARAHVAYGAATSAAPSRPASALAPRLGPTPAAVSPGYSDGSDSVSVVTADGAVVVLRNGAVDSVGAHDRATVSSWSAGDPVTVAAGGDHLTNLSTGARASVTPAGDFYLADPYSSTRALRKDTNSGDGRVIVLDDGSIWVVADPGDRARASTWPVGVPILAVDSASRRGYELVNTRDPSAIHAAYVGYG